MNMINNFPSFRGYKNVISNQMCDKDFRFAFFAAELDDKDGFHDLTQYRKLQDMAPQIQAHNPNDNVLFALYSEIPQGKKLFLNTTSMYFGDELKLIKDRMLTDDFKKEERAALKAYTLLASLSQRMGETSLCTDDAGIVNVFKTAYASLSVLFQSPAKAFNLMEDATRLNQTLERVGIFFNSVVKKSMQNYFK